ncbi:MAG: type II toxin-antitoxin system RelE/ParE family toxin [Verrucomicrobia bacterium]|nr:type II toxin-antitoxin system RelE/ParE family toxin [Verrucomicrobiota bacterium]
MRPLRFHPSVQKDINGAVNHYWAISEGLAEEFWGEVQGALAAIERAPEAHHFDPSGLRRSNLKRFPYNILYVIKTDRIRVQVVRHNSRRPGFGVRRSKA